MDLSVLQPSKRRKHLASWIGQFVPQELPHNSQIVAAFGVPSASAADATEADFEPLGVKEPLALSREGQGESSQSC